MKAGSSSADAVIADVIPTGGLTAAKAGMAKGSETARMWRGIRIPV
jgi:hypothetical protein